MSAARRVIAFLEDRRVLYAPEEMEVASHCVQSVLEIRHFLSGELGKLDANLGDQFAGKGLNIVDRADLTQFGKANAALPGEILAHAGVEAFESQAQNLDYTAAHNLANQFFGGVRYTDPIALPRGAAMATSGLSSYTFGRVDTTVNVQKIFVVPQPAASVPGNWEHINGNIIVSTSDKKQK